MFTLKLSRWLTIEIENGMYLKLRQAGSVLVASDGT